MSQDQDKKVIVIQGNVLEIGQTLTNLFGLNKKLVVHHHISTTGVRQLNNGGIVTPGQQNYEPVTVIYLVYSNPGELEGLQTTPLGGADKIRGMVKN